MLRKPTLLVSLFFVATTLLAGMPGERTIQLADKETVVQLWQEPGRYGPNTWHYSISGPDHATKRQTDYTLKLRYAEFDPLSDGEPFVPWPDLRGDGSQQLYIVQFITQPLATYLKTIEELGGQPGFYLPRHAFVVSMTATVAGQVAARPFVRWVGTYKPAYRLEPFLLQRIGLLPRSIYNIMVTEGQTSVKNRLADQIEALGATIRRRNAGKYLLEAQLTQAQLKRVSAFDEVLFIDRWSPPETDMDNIRALHGANHVEMLDGFSGEGVRGEVLDVGFNQVHVDFASRPLLLHTWVANNSHGASVSGIVFGDGNGDPMARGLLPSAQGILASTGSVFDGQARYDHTGELLQAPYFAVFQTSSVGSLATQSYTTLSAEMDAMLFDFDILHCQSQGNTGTNLSRPQAWAKNILSGGAVNHYDNQDREDDCWCETGSTGLASDGRVKPDLVSAYDAIYTVTTGSPTAYTPSFGGTSASTPIICGYAGLVFEMWSKGVFGNLYNPNATVFENRPHMTTAKALLINSAEQYTFTGPGDDLTRGHQGWGNPDVKNLFEQRDRLFVIDESHLLANTDHVSYQVTVVPGEAKFAATLVFADPPASPGASQHRVNDLTLRVHSPSGVSYWGNNGLLEGNWSTPNGDANHIDTVENVFVEDPEPGLWTIVVSADEINQDGHVETALLDADFALVASGVQVPGFTLSSRQTHAAACAPNALLFELDMAPVLGSQEPVTLSFSGLPLGASASFSQNPVIPTASIDLIISTTSQVPAGRYTLEISGQSTQMERRIFVDVTLAGEAPAPIALLSPPDESVRVSRKPVLTWAHDSNAMEYHFQLATDPLFEDTVAIETVSIPEWTAAELLAPLSVYYWRVRAVNTCATTNYSPTFRFSTIEVSEYQTEEFSAGFDLQNTALQFVPGNLAHYYKRCIGQIVGLPTDPSGGTQLVLGDNDFAEVNLSQPVSFFGIAYNRVYVGSNGYLTFGSGDSDAEENPEKHFSLPRISAIYDDLNPAEVGTVSYKELSDRLSVTFENVPEKNVTSNGPPGNPNTFQIELFHDGRIVINYLQTQAEDGLAGLSDGSGLSPDFQSSDLSQPADCLPCPADLNGDRVVDAADYAIALQSWRTPVLDLNDDGYCDVRDLLLFNDLTGACPK